MKTIDLPENPGQMGDLLNQARAEDLVVRMADGSEFLLIALDEFDHEFLNARGNERLMKLLGARGRQPASMTLEEVRRKLRI